MGGYGSGRRRDHKKQTVESCRALDIALLSRKGVLKRGTWNSGGLTWTAASGDKCASVGFELQTGELQAGDGAMWVRLQYTVGGIAPMDYRVPLETTPLHFGGERWWFRCPGAGCGRRVRKLYLCGHGPLFACRHCYNLTYDSAQSHDARVNFFLNHPEAAPAALDGQDWSRKFLVMRAVLSKRW
jgi:hypothetical protein